MIWHELKSKHTKDTSQPALGLCCHKIEEKCVTYREGSVWNQGLYWLSGKTSYRQISWSLEAARLGAIMIASFWHLIGISATPLPKCPTNVRAIGKVWTRISRLRYFTRSCGNTSVSLVEALIIPNSFCHFRLNVFLFTMATGVFNLSSVLVVCMGVALPPGTHKGGVYNILLHSDHRQLFNRPI